MANDDQAIPLLVTVGLPQHDSLELRFPPELRDELCAVLDEHHIEHKSILEFSADSELWVEAVKVLGGVGGGLSALVMAIRAFLRRNDGRKFVLKRGGEEVTAQGYSEKQVRALLELRAKEQIEVDDKFRRMLDDDSAVDD